MITSPDNYFVKHISVAASAALKIKILLVPVNLSLRHRPFDTDPGGQAT